MRKGNFADFSRLEKSVDMSFDFAVKFGKRSFFDQINGFFERISLVDIGFGFGGFIGLGSDFNSSGLFGFLFSFG